MIAAAFRVAVHLSCATLLGASGIGFRIAAKASARGAKVVILDVMEPSGDLPGEQRHGIETWIRLSDSLLNRKRKQGRTYAMCLTAKPSIT